MAYNAKEIWIPVDSSGALDIDAGANSGYISVKAGGSDIPRGICTGYYFKVSATDSNNTALPVKLFDARGGRLLYSTTVNGTSLTETVDTLDTPLPFFSTPYFVVGNIQGGAAASLTYEVKFFFKAMA